MTTLNYYKYLVDEYTNEKMSLNILSVNLQNKQTLENYMNLGYLWVRRIEYKFNNITRFPTVGCILEISNVRDIGSVLINSNKGKRMINKLCYF
jgi:hypothetical protein